MINLNKKFGIKGKTSCPGGKLRSKGLGRGLGMGKGPLRDNRAKNQLKARTASRKMYKAEWSEPLYKNETAIVDNSFISTNKGFFPENVKSVKSLKKGETWTEEHPLGAGVKIKRIR